jgi:hypothetical protein
MGGKKRSGHGGAFGDSRSSNDKSSKDKSSKDRTKSPSSLATPHKTHASKVAGLDGGDSSRRSSVSKHGAKSGANSPKDGSPPRSRTPPASPGTPPLSPTLATTQEEMKEDLFNTRRNLQGQMVNWHFFEDLNVISRGVSWQTSHFLFAITN